MNNSYITQTEFAEFFDSVSSAYGTRPIYFDGRRIIADDGDYQSWKFCLVNQDRTTYLFIPSHLAFFFIDVALYNLSPLPNTITTPDITYARLRYLYYRYITHQLIHIQPFAQ